MAIAFNGGHVIAANTLAGDVGTEDFTFEVFIRRDGNPSVAEYILAKTLVSGPWYYSWFQMGIAPDGKLHFYLKNPADTASISLYSTSTNVCDNNWHTVTMVWDISELTMSIYKDGVLDGSLYVSGGIKQLSASSRYLLIGCTFGTDAYLYPFLGDIAYVAAWSKVLSTAEMGVRPVGNESLLNVCYHLDEGSGTAINDSSPNNYDGTLSGTASWFAVYIISGTLYEKESDAAGSPEHYLIINPATGAVLVAGTAGADGAFTTDFLYDLTEYALIMPDKDGAYAPTCLNHYITGVLP